MKNPIQESEAVQYLFQDRQIHFLIHQSDENVMVNATEMAKAFGKRTTNYLANETTKELILKLELTEIPANSNYKVLENRGHMGYYFCEILALDFAAWLDIDFKIWIYKTIREILFGKYNIHRKKTIAIEQTKAKIEDFRQKLVSKNDADAIGLLKELDNLKQLQKDKAKAIVEQTKLIQLDLFLQNN